MSAIYAPGGAFAAVTPRAVAVFGESVPADVAADVWRALQDRSALPAVLEALTGAFGTDLAAIPPFAVAIGEGAAMRIAVRGDIAVRVEGDAGERTFSGQGVMTWTEKILDAVDRVSLSLPGGEAPSLPLADGVAAVSAIEWAAGAAPASRAAVAGPPAVVPTITVADEPVPARAASLPAAPAPAPAPDLPAMVADTIIGIRRSRRTAAAEPAGTPAAETADPAAFDHLWGATVVRSVEEAAVREHDEDASALGSIRLSTGQEVRLDRTVVIGRRPRATRVAGTDLPHLVAVDSPQQDVSRNHLEVRAEGDAIVATDLHTTNGTMLLRAGADPVPLHPGAGTVVVSGDVLDLGDGITVTVEERA